MERETGIEPATSSLGSWHSTAELLPLIIATLFYMLWRFCCFSEQQMYNKNVNFPSRFVVQPSVALQHISAWHVLYFLLRLFASAIATPHPLADGIKHRLHHNRDANV
jgi:hypothetical protein